MSLRLRWRRKSFTGMSSTDEGRPFLCLVLCLFDSRTPTIPPLSVTIHQGAAILADDSGEVKTVPDTIFLEVAVPFSHTSSGVIMRLDLDQAQDLLKKAVERGANR